jgi:hypothetical protein
MNPRFGRSGLVEAETAMAEGGLNRMLRMGRLAAGMGVLVASVLAVAVGAILITGGLWLRHLLRRHDKDHNTT